MLKKLKHTILIIASVLIAPSLVMGDEVSGRFGYLDLSKGLIVVDGKEITANMETTRISYMGENIGEEGLRSGDKITLVFNQNRGLDGNIILIRIILNRSARPGVDS